MEISEIYVRPGTDVMKTTMIELHEKGLFCDIRLNVGGTVFATHKPILYLNSPVLRNMLISETTDKYKEEIHLKDVDPGDFQLILRYMYTGQLSVTSANIMGIMKVSDYLEMSEIVKFCLSLLERFLDKDNALELFQYAHIFGGSGMKSKCRKKIFDNLLSVQTQLNSNCTLSDIKEILFEPFENELWAKTNAAAIYRSAMEWIRHDIEGREKHYRQLILRFDFSDFTGKFLKLIQSDVIFKRHPEVHIRVISDLSGKIEALEDNDRRNPKNESTTKGSLQFTFSNLDHLEPNELVHSDSVVYVKGLPWEIAVGKTEDAIGRSWLSVFACCNRERSRSHESCSATAQFTLLPYCPTLEKYTHAMNRPEKFHCSNRWGTVKFGLWKKILDPNNGFVSPEGNLSLSMSIDTDTNPFHVTTSF